MVGDKVTDPINPDHYRRFPVEVIERAKADAWDEACQAFAWCRTNGNDPLEDPLHYVSENNPYRKASDE